MKYYSIQIARGLAAVGVVVAHSYNHPLIEPNMQFIRLGRLGVILFFVISGFIMTVTTGTGQFNPTAFLQRRAIRVAPYYWLATLGVAALALGLPHLLKTTVFAPDHLLLSLLFVPHLDPVGSAAPLLKLGWTLNYEMFFYVCFALLWFTTMRTRVAVLTGGFLALIVLGRVVPFENEALRFYANPILLAFSAGAILGGTYLTLSLDVRSPAARALCAGLRALGLAGGLFLHPDERGGAFINACLLLASVAALLLLMGFENSLKDAASLNLIGDASYSIYLVHIYWIGLLYNVWTKLAGTSYFAAYLVLAVAGGIGVGIAAYFCIERPLLQLMRRLTDRRVRTANT